MISLILTYDKFHVKHKVNLNSFICTLPNWDAAMFSCCRETSLHAGHPYWTYQVKAPFFPWEPIVSVVSDQDHTR